MRKLLVLMLALVVGTFFVAPLSAGGGNHTLPFYGNMSGFLGEFVVDPDKIAARCEVPDGKFGVWAIASFEGEGTVTHMGKSHVIATHCSYLGLLPDGSIGMDGTYGQGMLTTTAANGDVLLATYDNGSSYLNPDGSITFMDDFTFVDGGTGRFSLASGGGTEIGSVSFGDGTFFVELFGEISYKRK